MLSAKTIEIVKATAPVIAATGPTLTAHFYDRMFAHNPELKDIFNMSNQRNGNQREALFNAICAYANNIDNLGALLGAVEKIAHKHTSFLITAEQYNIVGGHLLATIDELLSPGEDVLNAWAEAYGVLASVFIQREEQIYQQNESIEGGWRGYRDFELVEKKPESDTICSFIFKPTDGGKVTAYKPGQYIGICLNSDTFDNQEIRQYSLSSAPHPDHYRISVKKEPQGVVSSFLHHQLCVGDIVKLVPPAGDFFLEVAATTPVALISAGVGLTPTLSMLESLTAHQAPVTWVHATENGAQHAFKDYTDNLAKKYDHIESYTWYNNPADSDHIDLDFQFTGLLNIEEIAEKIIQPEVQVYFCGPVGFMKTVATQFMNLGLNPSQLHYECFGPHQIIAQ
jgi:nitric oxide dioxygenase